MLIGNVSVMKHTLTEAGGRKEESGRGQKHNCQINRLWRQVIFSWTKKNMDRKIYNKNWTSSQWILIKDITTRPQYHRNVYRDITSSWYWYDTILPRLTKHQENKKWIHREREIIILGRTCCLLHMMDALYPNSCKIAEINNSRLLFFLRVQVGQVWIVRTVKSS